MERFVSLKEILSEGYVKQNGDYIQVTAIWSSGFSGQISNKSPCRFILADGETHIAAIVFLNGGTDTDALNVCRQLQKRSTYYKLTNYKVWLTKKCRIFRNHDMEVKLSTSTMDVKEVSGSYYSERTQQAIPFEFTELSKIDDCSMNQLVDIIGYTTVISECKKGQKNESVVYKTVTLGEIPSENREGFERNIALFGKLVNENLRLHQVYAMLNINVEEWEQFNKIRKKSLKATSTTVIFEINGLQDLPFHYHPEKFIQTLLQATRAPLQVNRISESLKLEVTPGSECHAVSSSFGKISSIQNEALTESVDSDINALEETPQSTLDVQSPSVSNVQSSPSDSNNYSGLFKIPCPNGRQIPGASNFKSPDLPISNSESSQTYQITKPSSNIEPTNSEEFFDEISSTHPTKRCKIIQKSGSFEDKFPNYTYDFLNNDEPLEVYDNAVRSNTFMDRDEDTYRMRSDPRGIALIINNAFPGDKEKYREGSHHDVEYLRQILQIMKFTIFVKENLRVDEIRSALETFKKRATAEMEACFVAILTHGCHGLVEMADDTMVRLPNDIIHQFGNNTFPILAGKPKIFLIQACQNISLDPNVISHVHPVMPVNEDELDLENIIEIYSGTPGTFAPRDNVLGSQLIYIFVDILSKHAHDTDLETMLCWVQYCLAHKVISQETAKLHCTWVKHRFNKKLFFNPGLSSSQNATD